MLWGSPYPIFNSPFWPPTQCINFEHCSQLFTQEEKHFLYPMCSEPCIQPIPISYLWATNQNFHTWEIIRMELETNEYFTTSLFVRIECRIKFFLTQLPVGTKLSNAPTTMSSYFLKMKSNEKVNSTLIPAVSETGMGSAVRCDYPCQRSHSSGERPFAADSSRSGRRWRRLGSRAPC